MKKLIVLSLALISSCSTIICLDSCSSHKRVQHFSWVGHQERELIYRIGPPNGTRGDDNGGKIDIYTHNVSSSDQYGSVQQRRSTLYYINPQGTIYHILEENK